MKIFTTLSILLISYSPTFAQKGLDSLRLVLPVGLNSTIESAFFNNKSNFIVSFSRDYSAVLYSVHSGKELLRFNSTENKKYIQASFSNNSRYLALVNTQGIDLIDLESGLFVNVFDDKNIPASCVEFIENDQKLIFGLQDSTINVYDLINREIVMSTKVSGVVNRMEVNKEEDKIILKYQGLFGEKSNLFSVFSVMNCILDSIVLPENAISLDVQFLQKQNGLFYSYYDDVTGKSFVKLYDLKKRSIIVTKEFDFQIYKTQVNLARDLFLIVCADHTVSVYNFESFELIKKVIKHDYFISDAKFSLDGKFIASCSLDGSLKICNLIDFSIIMSFKNEKYRYHFLNFDDKGEKLVAGGDNKILSFYDIKEKVTYQFKGYALKPISIKFSNDGKKLLASFDDYSTKEISLSIPQIEKSYLPHQDFTISKYSIENKLIVTASLDSTSRIYSVGLTEPIFVSLEHGNSVNSVSLSHNSKFITTTTGNIGSINSEKAVRIIDISTKETIDSFKTKAFINSSDFSCDDRELLVSTGAKVILYDRATKSVTNSFTHGKSSLTNSEFGKECKVILISCADGTIYLLNRNDFSLLDSIKINDTGQITAYYDISKQFIIVRTEMKIRIFNIGLDNKLNEIHVFKPSLEIFDADIFGKTLVFSSIDQKTIFVNLGNGIVICELIQLLNNNWLVKLPNSPYYMCSKDASKMLHYVTPSLKVIGFEQLDPVYNRPDIVLDSIGKYFGGADHELVANYRQSWEKRIDRLGLDKEKLGKGEIAVPSAEIIGADEIAYESKDGKLEINVSANDAKYPLRRFNVYVNEVPLYGSVGISIAHLNKQVWDTTISFPLSVGENKIQVSVMNELGLENFKYPTYVNYSPQEQLQAKTYYIGIGVNEFAQSAHNLKYCVKDVTDLAKSFGGANTEVKLFTDQQVTKENILALKEYLKKTSVNDKVIISCSSHGLLDDSLNFYLAMHDVDFKNPKMRGLKYEELESLLDGIPARQKLLLLDACNSGENDKTELLKKEIEQNLNTMDTTQLLAVRGVVIELEEENTNNFKKINELFVNVRNNTGSVIISAAGGQQSALEAIEVDGKIIENGAFTFSILECLKQNQSQLLKVNTLKQYAEKRVEEITNGKQKPTSRQETMEIDWGVR
jgi:WD40 repeat protein